MKLRCGVYGEGSVFSVDDIEHNADVEALQKKFADILSTKQHTVPPRMLTLYLARKNGETAWMKHDHNTESFLQDGVDTSYDKMLSSWKLNKKKLLGPNFTTGDEEIHVLVKVQKDAVANKKQILKWQSTRYGSHAYNSSSQYFLLEKEDMDASGLPPIRLMLYCRPTFHRQFEFLRDKVLNGGHLGWILGPPG